MALHLTGISLALITSRRALPLNVYVWKWLKV
jgi:hypothetical protein